MRRKAIILLTVIWLTLGVVLTPGSRARAASEAATLKSVTLSTSPTGTELALRVDGTYSYKTVQASPDTLFIDLAGAKVGGVAPNRQWVNPVFSGYKLLPYQDATGQPVVRVQVGTTSSPTLRRSKGRLNAAVGLWNGSICRFGGCPRVR